MMTLIAPGLLVIFNKTQDNSQTGFFVMIIKYNLLNESRKPLQVGYGSFEYG